MMEARDLGSIYYKTLVLKTTTIKFVVNHRIFIVLIDIIVTLEGFKLNHRSINLIKKSN